MNGNVGVHCIGIQSLADNQTSLAMRIAAGSQELNVGGQCQVSLELPPDKVERIDRCPHVGPATGDCVAASNRIKLRRSAVCNLADIARL